VSKASLDITIGGEDKSARGEKPLNDSLFGFESNALLLSNDLLTIK
jgi:hypothetical protein